MSTEYIETTERPSTGVMATLGCIVLVATVIYGHLLPRMTDGLLDMGLYGLLTTGFGVFCWGVLILMIRAELPTYLWLSLVTSPMIVTLIIALCSVMIRLDVTSGLTWWLDTSGFGKSPYTIRTW